MPEIKIEKAGDMFVCRFCGAYIDGLLRERHANSHGGSLWAPDTEDLSWLPAGFHDTARRMRGRKARA